MKLRNILILIFYFHYSNGKSSSRVSMVSLPPRPRGLFIQISTISSIIPYLDLWLESLCYRNQMLGPHNNINDIVLQDLAIEHSNGSYTMQTEALDIITKYLPGGSKACFGNVFVGTMGVSYGNRNFNEAIRDSAFRQKYFDVAQDLAQKFRSRYPNIYVNWYITAEAVLHDLVDDNVKTGWEELLSGTIKVLTAIQQRSIMWSPSFWHSWTYVTEAHRTKLSQNLKSLFTNLAIRSPPGINWMNLQDGVGKYNPYCPTSATSITESDAVKWYYFLKATYSFSSFQMNEELFTFNCMEIFGSNATVQRNREKYYTENGVMLGPAFELRYWRERYGGWDE